jgi:transposase
MGDGRYEEAERRIRELEVAVADRDAVIASLKLQLEALEQKVNVLTSRLSENSKNSSRPPSSDPPGKSKGKKGKSKRKRGAQPGHKGRHRELLPPERVDHIENVFPPECENCWKPLPEVVDADARRHQVTEIPPLKPYVTEHREHTVACLDCGYRTEGRLDPAIACSSFGPRLSAIVGLLTGVYHVSRRKTLTLLSDLLGVEMSLGSVSAIEERISDSLEHATAEVFEKVSSSPVIHTDGTGWSQAGEGKQIWTIASAVGTAFRILKDGSAESIKSIFVHMTAFLVSDRAKALLFWCMNRRQICWSHLIRKFVSFSERDGPSGKFGEELLEYAGIIFEYWHQFKDGTLSRARLEERMQPVQAQVEALLEKVEATKIRGLSGACSDIVKHKPALWLFVTEDGVEPTNNHAEQEIRDFVLWRKRSFGSQSDRGDKFAERIMTVTHTARKQRRDVLSFLVESHEAYRYNRPSPSLFSAYAPIGK